MLNILKPSSNPTASECTLSCTMVIVCNQVLSTKAIELLQESVQKMLMFQVVLLICWLSGVMLQHGVNVMLKRMYSLLVKLVARAKDEMNSSIDEFEGEALRRTFQYQRDN